MVRDPKTLQQVDKELPGLYKGFLVDAGKLNKEDFYEQITKAMNDTNHYQDPYRKQKSKRQQLLDYEDYRVAKVKFTAYKNYYRRKFILEDSIPAEW
jgi:hypothetical protein